MQTPRPPMAQTCQMSKAHSSSARGKAITNPRAKPRWLGDRTTRASDAIGCRFHISAKPKIVGPLSNTFE
jgi:hypothetical protein